mmetsp:Transcript_4006/g.9335  ORF Transcript_4006/g.9335 Transcript_4006/m.9335 type:complete len:956 (-) Transcript_4006:123-2990(-)|eukprot:CAMPEP_0170617218 /NCGR_PEP_ID=MMETSP0224-20130122/26297_1 /TAXON_ID=285029 /ORGANISM="Togula jolla, Strain CCCM 725" /LENGTH=955 /DNA_ID=CAMNT_0010943089 /DNA_START=200 /DNA_END=3067 /DNA_ORIENTATION=+
MASTVAAGLASVGMGGKAIFEYNRDNFLFDREMRLRKELQLMRFKMEQGGLWREDVRDLISLTEYKMHVYLLVNVLMLGFTVVLWCEGRLPESTPDWLMIGSALSITGAFVFLLLSIWLAMHAAIAAQAFETRLLTQLVRLPMPTWNEIEACRTNASDFERVEAKQMFRVPWVMGRQENLVEEAQVEPEDDGSSSEEGPPDAVSCDPWGLERAGNDIDELGCKQGGAVASLRHIKLARQAMVHWQSYDAFARISMSIGVNQLLLAMSYYVLGYVLVEVGCRTAACYGVILLTAMAEMMVRLDMSLSLWELRIVQLVLAFGPTMSCLAAFHWARQSQMGVSAAQSMVSVAFVAHGLYMGIMAKLCRIKQQDNGTMLPTAFRSVLYLDVFGWLSDSRTRDRRQAGGGGSSRHGREARAVGAPFTTVPSMLSQATNMVSERSNGGAPGPDVEEPAHPAMEAIRYVDGRPAPRRPEDMAPVHQPQDLRFAPGAPHPNDDPVAEDCAPFYKGAGWMPGAKRREDEDDDEAFAASFGASAATGHDADLPGVLPWRVFSSALMSLCIAWILAAIYLALGINNYWDLDPPVAWETQKTASGDEPWERKLENGAAGLLGLYLPGSNHIRPAGMEMETVHASEGMQRVAVTWPHSNVQPRGLACDSAGQHFAITDGIQLFNAQLTQGAGGTHPVVVASEPTRSSKLLPPLRSKKPTAAFGELECSSIVGQGLQDMAVTCGADNGDYIQGCRALVLHDHGRRVSACLLQDLHEPEALFDSQTGLPIHRSANVANISDSWLEQLRDTRVAVEQASPSEAEANSYSRVEKTLSIAIDDACLKKHASSRECLYVGTTHGHVVQLASTSSKNLLVPTSILHEGISSKVEQLKPSTVRVLNDRFLAVLRKNSQVIQVLDVHSGGTLFGNLWLPKSLPVTGFCSGGGYIYMLGAGSSPEMHRIQIPKEVASS